MKILDLCFYFVLCVVACISFFIFNSNKELYFSIPTFNTLQPKTYEIYENDKWSISNSNIKSIDIERIDDTRYLISYVGINNNEQKLYGILFYPNKYSTLTHDGKWQNIVNNSKTKSIEHLLFAKTSFSNSTKQPIYSFNTPLFKRDDSMIYLLFNANIYSDKNYSRMYIFSVPVSDMIEYLENKESNYKFIFSLHNKPYLSFVANMNAFLSHKPIIALGQTDSDLTHNNFILPFYINLNNNSSLFGIFDSKFNIQETIKTDNTYLSKPLIIPIYNDYKNQGVDDNSMETSHTCMAFYRSMQEHNDSKLYYQSCKIGNGTLSFNDLNISKNIKVGTSLNAATTGSHIILVYTSKNDSVLNLAAWNGEDFIKIKELDRHTKGKITASSIASYGDHTYIVYNKEMQDKINVITINQAYIDSLMTNEN